MAESSDELGAEGRVWILLKNYGYDAKFISRLMEQIKEASVGFHLLGDEPPEVTVELGVNFSDKEPTEVSSTLYAIKLEALDRAMKQAGFMGDWTRIIEEARLIEAYLREELDATHSH